MSKSKFFSIVLVLSLFSLSSCVKDVKDAVDESVNALECTNLLKKIDEEEGSRLCPAKIADINKILNTCDEFLTQEQKDQLNFAKDNCTDN